VRIAQLTDTHVTLDGAQARYLTEALVWVGTCLPRPDAVVISGDTVDGGRREQYARLSDVLSAQALPIFLIPGNHDRRAPLRTELPAVYYPGTPGERLNYVVDAGAVRLVALDTSQPRHSGGFVDDASLTWLETVLRDAPQRPVFLFMHHPPFRTGVNMADLLGFRGLRRLREIIAANPAVRRLVAGHIHCERQARIGQTLASTGISSAPQTVPELFERRLIGLRPEPPGLTLHDWNGEHFASTTYVNAGDGRFTERTAGSSATPSSQPSPN
jgi:3',5'-cyclic AMP phosphodiesterase CpdA